MINKYSKQPSVLPSDAHVSPRQTSAVLEIKIPEVLRLLGSI